MNKAACSRNRRKFGRARAKSEEQGRGRVVVEYVADKVDGARLKRALNSFPGVCSIGWGNGAVNRQFPG